MIIGYSFQCQGLKEPMHVRGNSYDECYYKFREYWSSDYDVETDKLTSVNSIEFNFYIV